MNLCFHVYVCVLSGVIEKVCVVCIEVQFVSYSESLSQRLYSGREQKSGRTSVTFRSSFSRRFSFSLSLRSRHGSCLQARKHPRSTRLSCRQMEGQTGTEQVSNKK